MEIDNLLGMEKLQKLQLDNNIITKIKGLNFLVNLKWLDLSFNQISVIEGLDKCNKIQDLSLFSNKVKELSGIENLPELNVLSVGKNALSNLDKTIHYLTSLKNKLEVLKLSENNFPKQNEKTYHLRCIAHLKNLQYLDYELISSKMRNDAMEEYKDEITNTQTEDLDKDSKVTMIDPELSDAKIGITVGLFKNAIESLSPDEMRMRVFTKFQDIFLTSEGPIDDFT